MFYFGPNRSQIHTTRPKKPLVAPSSGALNWVKMYTVSQKNMLL